MRYYEVLCNFSVQSVYRGHVTVSPIHVKFQKCQSRRFIRKSEGLKKRGFLRKSEGLRKSGIYT